MLFANNMNGIPISWRITLLILAALVMGCHNDTPTMLMAGSGWDEIVKTDKNGHILWRHKLEQDQECNEITELANGNILYAHRTGAKVITARHEVVWEYLAPEGTELQSASVTKEGNYLLGQCGCPAKIMEFTPQGDKLKELVLNTGIKKPHSQFRRIRKTEKGTYLVPILSKGEVHEYNEDGLLLQVVKVGGVPFSLVVLPSNNWLVSLGDAHRLVEINPQTSEVIWEVNEYDIDSVALQYVAEAIRLENGHTIICNWGGHARNSQPTALVVEIDSDANVIWKLEDKDNLGLISTIDPHWHLTYLR